MSDLNIKRLTCFVVILTLSLAPAIFAAPGQGDEVPGLRSENAAFLISLVGTVLPVGIALSVPDDGIRTTREDLLFLGTAIGPSLGYFYCGRVWRGLLTVVLRLALAGATYGFSTNEDALNGLGYVTAGLYIGSAIFDLVSVRKAVRKRNEAVRARKRLDVSVAPFIMARAKGAGIRIQLSF